MTEDHSNKRATKRATLWVAAALAVAWIAAVIKVQVFGLEVNGGFRSVSALDRLLVFGGIFGWIIPSFMVAHAFKAKVVWMIVAPMVGVAFFGWYIRG